MNILFFLTPKSEVAYIPADESLRQAFEKLKYHGYSAVPTLTDDGKYAGTITEGDVLRAMESMCHGFTRCCNIFDHDHAVTVF